MWDQARARRARTAVRSKRARVRIDAEAEAIGPRVRQMFDELDALSVPTDDRHMVELALCEIVSTVRSAAFGDGPGGTIMLSAGPAPRGLWCQLIDNGRAMARDAADIPRALSLHGGEASFGWLMVESLTRDLRYRPRPGMNVLSFRMPVQGFATEHVF